MRGLLALDLQISSAERRPVPYLELVMKQQTQPETNKFVPELYCLRCQLMEWDEEERACTNFETGVCPLVIRKVLAKLSYNCLVV